ncbi:hypothetical protein D3C72_1123150 [compost metagenome]
MCTCRQHRLLLCHQFAGNVKQFQFNCACSLQVYRCIHYTGEWIRIGALPCFQVFGTFECTRTPWLECMVQAILAYAFIKIIVCCIQVVRCTFQVRFTVGNTRRALNCIRHFRVRQAHIIGRTYISRAICFHLYTGIQVTVIAIGGIPSGRYMICPGVTILSKAVVYSR